MTSQIICAVAAAALCFIFLLLALIFTVFGAKSAKFISGFDLIPKDQRELYDQAAMAKDQRNLFFLLALIMALGAVLSYFISAYLAILAFVILLALLWKNVRSDEKKAFAKYQKH